MALRTRLTLFYTSLLGVVLILFGVTVYGVVSVVLIRQIDKKLEASAEEMVENIYVSQRGQLSLVRLLSYDPGVVLQVWDTEGRLAGPTQPLDSFINVLDPLYPQGLESEEVVYNDVTSEGLHLQVMSVPITSGGQRVGTLQAGADLGQVDAARSDLLLFLAVISVAVVSVAGVAGWFTTRSALEPLAAMTEVALRITRADDLSLRIQQQQAADDEVGKLIQAFNQTLSRLEELFHSQRRFMADVSHELRTPLTSIKGNVDLIRRMGQIDEQSLNSIETEVERLTRLVGDIVLLGQAESGKLPLDLRTVELDTLLLDVFQQARVLAADRVDVRIADIDQVLVCGDRDRLKQVMLNLVGNAVKYTPQGGEIVITLGKSDGWSQFTVADTGPGIPPEDLPHIFERFYRADKSRTDKGFGLGLSIAYWIVQAHGGRIEVDSKNGVGTTFCVWLPLAVEDVKASPN